MSRGSMVAWWFALFPPNKKALRLTPLSGCGLCVSDVFFIYNFGVKNVIYSNI